jgi:hypothetical protein
MAKSRSHKYKSRAARRSAKIIKSYKRKDGKIIPEHCTKKGYTVVTPTKLSKKGKTISRHCRKTPLKIKAMLKSKRDAINKAMKEARKIVALSGLTKEEKVEEYGDWEFNLPALGYRIKKRSGSRKSKRRSHKKSHGRKGSKKSHSRKSKKSYRKKRSTRRR